MIERVVSSEVQKTYEELRSILLENNCRIIMEEPLKSIIVEHGTPSSLSPRDTWKKVSFHLFPDPSGTRIIGSSSIIFPIPVSIITQLIIMLLVFFTISILTQPIIAFLNFSTIWFFTTGIGTASFVGLISTLVVYENYYRLYRRRNLFLEEVFRLLMQKAGKLK